ncbi:hypothetical protein PPYR_04298 [Photinus pyralis]|uniref:Pentraxin (PTX) domain-containing protein n=1 Tax=Photinus pyralis TaxID=7054 RepID=A0A5N4AXL6_PHOPY|nr:uncharacterized protein LOC116163626 [Photinus pyralis]XP_031333515.1 uncharacterized protein LOC116163626 [Photinus pyralis]XP_031333516.1 uncharacterized protein LOC116163626 [Photinus pyralis]KAB0802112.1 hypothetical protein PPYR_04298 [Photinus pyralis]
MVYVILFMLILPVCRSIADWQPVLHPDLYPNLKTRFPSEPHFSNLPTLIAQSYQQPGLQHGGGQCDLHKVGFTQDLYFQYIQYKAGIPDLKEFTLCYWAKFNNHSNDHPIFSYAVDGQPKAILSWVSNTERSSYFSLGVGGHTFYRLNYPLRLNRWYHTCQSWNGRTGEWQIWVNAERVGRGFHNRLVGHHIPSGGIAITGQEQTQYGGGFLEGVEAPKGSGGMLGEVTMVQLYRVALTAGKAHKDHKHHHAHTFDHNGMPITTTPRPPSPPRPMTPTHPLLTGGQLNPNIALTIASGQMPLQVVPGQNFDAQFLNGQFVSNLVTQQLMNTPQSRGPQQFLADPNQQPQAQPPPIQFLTSFSQLPTAQPSPIPSRPPTSSFISGGLVHPSLINPANVQFIDSPFGNHHLFKRDQENATQSVKQKRHASEAVDSTSDDMEEKKHIKRELYLKDGAFFDDSLFKINFDQSLLSGLAGIGQNQPIQQQQKESEKREPAEAEVKAILNLCSGCAEEPFGKALVFGWRTVPKKLYSGAFYTPANPQCKAF